MKERKRRKYPNLSDFIASLSVTLTIQRVTERVSERFVRESKMHGPSGSLGFVGSSFAAASEAEICG